MKTTEISKNRVFILDSSSDVTGALKSALILANVLSEFYEVSFIMPLKSKAKSKILDAGYEVIELPVFGLRKNLNDILLYIPRLINCSVKMLDILNTYNSNLLILNDFDKPYGIFLKLFLWKGNIYTFVRRRPSSFNKLLSTSWAKLAILSSKKVIAVSNIVLDELPNKSNITRIYNSLDINNSEYKNNYPELSPVKFLFLGNYMPDKGQLEALEAFRIAYEKNQDIRLDFFGGTLDNDKNKAFKHSLLEKAKEYKLEHVIMFGDYVDDIEELMSHYHVVLNLSISESFSRVCVEAALSSRPLIATNSGGPQEIIIHSKTGFLVDIGDVKSIAYYMLWFTKNSSKISIMGKKSREYVLQKFSYENFRLEVLSLIK